MAPDARVINLETSITASDDCWKGKGITYEADEDEELPGEPCGSRGGTMAYGDVEPGRKKAGNVFGNGPRHDSRPEMEIVITA